MEREMLKLSQDTVMVDMAMEDLMEVMVTEAMVDMDMERERLKLTLSQDMDMVVMVMEDLMGDMEDTEAMEVMVMEREMLSQVMAMVVMDMEDLMEVMVDTEAMDMVVMAMESNFNPTISKHCRL